MKHAVFTHKALAVALGFCLAFARGANAGALRAEAVAESASLLVSVEPGRSLGGLTLVQVVDAATGAVVKTLHAGQLSKRESFGIKADESLVPGAYKVRYRAGVELSVDTTIKRPDSTVPGWLNPVDVWQRGDSVYVLDAGEVVPETRPDYLEERSYTTKDGTVVTGKFYSVIQGVLNLTTKDGHGSVVSNYEIVLKPESVADVKKMEKGWQEHLAKQREKNPRVFKMDRDGKLDAAFGEGGAIVLDERYLLGSAIAVAPDDGRLFLTSMGHHLIVYGADGKLTPQTVGGWEAPPLDSKWCTPGPQSVAFGPNNRIYIPGGPYANGKVYDRTKNGADGILYPFTLPECEGLDRYICGDGRGAFFTCGRADQLTKHVDDGKTVKLVYTTPSTVKLARPTGGCAGGGLVWWVCHGPGYGPFWDSGGGDEVVLFWDSGTEVQLIDRFGTPGTAADRLEFRSPRAIAVNAQQTEAFIVEDATVNAEGPKGNARVRRFKIKARVTEELPITLPPVAAPK